MPAPLLEALLFIILRLERVGDELFRATSAPPTLRTRFCNSTESIPSPFAFPPVIVKPSKTVSASKVSPDTPLIPKKMAT